MAKNKRNKPIAPPPQAGGSAAGQEVHPDTLSAVPDPGCAGGAIPIGLPIPIERYNAIQASARRRKPSRPGLAQEDPGSGDS